MRVAHKYRLSRRIGTGAMGEVWRARNEATGAQVALKVMTGHAESTALRFRNEAKLGSTLSHRGIVRIFDLVEEGDGELALVMELLRGESLEECLARKGTLSSSEAVAIALPVLSALAHVHASGVVHRDLKPANIFLAIDPDGTVVPKLVDFGIAKIAVGARAMTLDGNVLGTPSYMAPEQIRGTVDLDGRSDLFSLAVTLYESIAGVCPFKEPTAAASLAAVLESPVDPDPKIPPPVWVELRRALSKQPYERHRDADELAAALRAAVGESDASLAALLKRDPPVRAEEEDPSRPPSSNPSFSGHLLEVPGSGARAGAKSRRLRAAGAIGLLGLFGLVLMAAVARRPSGEVLASAPVPSVTATTPAPGVSVSPPAPAVAQTPALPETNVAASVAPAATGAATRKSHPRPRVPPRPAPVATTPGF